MVKLQHVHLTILRGKMDKNTNLMTINSNMSDELADLIGTLIFQQKMLARLIEKRETGEEKYCGWHQNHNLTHEEHNEWLQTWLHTCIHQKRWVDAANLCMMLALRKDIK